MLPPSINTPTMNDNQSLAGEQITLQLHPILSLNKTTTNTSFNASVTTNNKTTRLKSIFSKTFANTTKTNLYSNSSASSSAADVLAGKVYDGILSGKSLDGVGGDGYPSTTDMAVPTFSTSTQDLETSTPFPTAQTVATIIGGNKNRVTTTILYPTVSPESVVIPIVSCIFGFPILAFIVICCLRHRAQLARERDRRRNYELQDQPVSLVRFSPTHRHNQRSSRAISLHPDRSLSQGIASIELDTVVEERSSNVEQIQTEFLRSESPMETSSVSCKTVTTS